MILLFALRHGSTEANSEGKFRGWLDDDTTQLDAQGKHDAHMAAEFLKDRGITMVYCSDLGRAYDTAKIVCDTLGLGDPQPDHRLRAWNVGFLAGKNKDEYQDYLDDAIDHPKEPLEDGESLHDFSERTQEAIAYYIDEAREEGIKLIVAHTSNMIQLVNYCKGEGADGRPESEHVIKPGGVIEVREQGGTITANPILKRDKEAEYGS